MNVYFVYKNIITGGCELLIERLSRELKNRSISVSIIFHSIDQNMQYRYENAGLQLTKVDSWSRDKINASLDSKEAHIITFVWNDFILCNINGSHIHTVFYAVHYQAFEMGRNKSKLFKELLQKVAIKAIARLSKNGQLICMDEQTLKYTKKYYGLRTLQLPILRLAIDVVPKVERIIDASQLHILTIARSEFPFKGYILGLLDWFATADNDVELTIVSYGPDEKNISNKIESFDETVKKRITFVGKTNYGKLEQYYKVADLYVGMGTTVLDASLRGIVSIPVQAYTLDLITDKFFFEDCRRVAIDEGSKDGFNTLFERYRALDSKQKSNISRRSREMVLDNYSSPVIADELVHILASTKNNCSTIGLELVRLYHQIKTIIKGDKRK